MGIRFLGGTPGRPIPFNCVMELEIGAPLVPPAPAQASMAAVSAWHALLMTHIARLSGKAWTEPQKRDQS